MRVTNLSSPRSGRPVANQYIINDYDGEAAEAVEFFQSYETTIAKNQGGHFTISEDWNYSRTTTKYFYEWLRGWGLSDEIPAIKKWLKGAKPGDQDLSRSRFTLELVEELR